MSPCHCCLWLFWEDLRNLTRCGFVPALSLWCTGLDEALPLICLQRFLHSASPPRSAPALTSMLVPVPHAGHNATRDRAQGGCYFNSVAVAARAVQAKTSARRILVLDWDIHWGRGTQEIFAGDEQVLCLSLHRDERCGAGRQLGCIGVSRTLLGLGVQVSCSLAGQMRSSRQLTFSHPA